MSDPQDTKLAGPDLAQGVALADLADGAMLLGHKDGEAALLARRGDELFAIGATCTHYGGPLAEGLLVGDTVRCPWHHACFSLRSGEALRAPALNAVSCWHVERRDGKAFVGAKIEPPKRAAAPARAPQSVVIVGGGAAGQAAAETLRREGFAGRLTMLSSDASAPVDRPNLSKNYLAGTAPEDWIPLRPSEFYRDQGIELKLGARVEAIEPTARQVVLTDGSRHGWDALLLATGAEPIRLDLPGATLPHVHLLRTLADSRALVAAAKPGARAVVVGSSFIGLEVAASLRARDVAVQVVSLDAVPMIRVLGDEVGSSVRRLHEQHGVVFHLGTAPTAIDARAVTLRDGTKLEADFVVIGVGVRPAIALAQAAGLTIDHGVSVDEYLQTSAPGIYAAGDIARWPDRGSGQRIRVEHWVVAQRQGRTAARNMLGARERFDAVPFFWTEQYDFVLAYVGHAERFDRVQIDGDLAARDCTVSYFAGDRRLAVATVGRDLQSLRTELDFERAIAKAAA
ncbi:MAG: FAD-dependent oxidoreductase [Burkholderiaceae bacterium]|nr:FAD-dependent oxidoreductase [Burkholderiaceae bacterium]